MTLAAPVRVLSIDGGGMRGYIPALVLAELERRLGVPLRSTVDLVVGTSTGAILAIGLAAGMSAEDLAGFYPKHGRTIFGGVERSVWERRIWDSLDRSARNIGGPFGGNANFGGNARHRPDGLEQVLQAVLGDRRLSDLDMPLAVTTFDANVALPVVLTSSDAKLDPRFDLPLWQAARATSAAPTYFPPFEVDWAGQRRSFVDGGVWANNPAGVAIVESLALTSARGLTGTSVVMVSLGTGVAPPGVLFDADASWLGSARDLAGLATSVWAGDAAVVGLRSA